MNARVLTAVWIALVCALFHASAIAQSDWPSKPVRIVTPHPPGGSGDLLGRLFAERLVTMWAQPVVVENRPGASTIIGTDLVAKAPPDGYTLLLATDTSITSNPHLFAKMPYDALRDLAPISQLVAFNMVVVVHPSVAASSIAELVALAKAQPGRLNYGSYGAGSQPHLSFETLKAETGINIVHVPYKGLAPAVTATMAGEVQMTLASAATAAGQLQSGKLKALPIKDSGYPNLDPRGWMGFFAPAGTPASILTRIQRDVVQIMSDPEFREREINRRGYTAVGSTAEEFAAYVKEDYEYKGRVIRAIGIRAE
jgi:tripartite-type tricarboxylate transporter receptor subunit TctC